MRQSVCLSMVIALLVAGCGSSQPAPLTPISPVSNYQQAPAVQQPLTASNVGGYEADEDYDDLEAAPAPTAEPTVAPTPAPTPTPAPVQPANDDETELPIVVDNSDDEPEQKPTLKEKVVNTGKKVIGFVKGIFGKD